MRTPVATPSADEISIVGLGRDALAYASGGFAYKVVALLSVPVFARILTPSQLGLLDLGAVVASGLAILVALGLDHGIPYHLPRSRDDTAIWSSALVLVGAAAAGVAVVGVLLQDVLAAVLTGDAGNRSIFVAASLYGAASGFALLALTAVRLRGRPRTYAVVSFLVVTVEMGAALVAAIVLNAGVPAIIIAWAVGSLVIAVPALVQHLPRVAAPTRATVGRLAGFGAPLVPAAVAWIVGDAVIRAVIARELAPANLGEYGIAVRLVSVLAIAIGGLGIAWHPYLYRSAVEHVGPRTERIGTYALGVVMVGAALLAVLAPELAAIVSGPGYPDASDAVPGLAAGMLAFCLIVLLTSVVGYRGSTRLVAVAAGIGAVGQWVAAGALIPGWGLFGAGVASAVGYGLAAAVMAVAALRVIPARTIGILVVVLVAGATLVILAGGIR